MSNSGYCPKCNNPIKEYDDKLTDSYGIKYGFTCENCGFEGFECYDTVFSGFEDDGNIMLVREMNEN